MGTFSNVKITVGATTCINRSGNTAIDETFKCSTRSSGQSVLIEAQNVNDSLFLFEIYVHGWPTS